MEDDPRTTMPSFRATMLQEYLRDMSARDLGAHFRDGVAFAKARFCSWGPTAQAEAIKAAAMTWSLERAEACRDWFIDLVEQMKARGARREVDIKKRRRAR